MQEVKKQLEVLLISYFRESYKEFPKGKIVASESPDFVVKMKNRSQLGIELTRLNPANALPNSDERIEEITFRESFIETSREQFESRSPFKLFVKFLFSEKEKLIPELEMVARARVLNLIQENIKNKNIRSFFQFNLAKSLLPTGLRDVLVVHHPELQTSVWERSNNLGISTNVVDDIRQSIQKKDEKLRLYQKQQLNYYWLLITTDCLRGSKNTNLPNKILHEEFYSHFQHVFLFDLMKNKVTTLK